MTPLQVYFALFILSLMFTEAIRRYALRKNLMDVPNERSSHSVSTPRGGGASIVLTFLMGLFYFYLTKAIPNSLFEACLGATLIVALVGLWDDFGQISQKLRILAHFAAAGWALYFIGDISSVQFVPGVSIPLFVLYPFLAFFLVWLLNLYNFMDGIDGIAASETIFIAVGGALLFALNDETNPTHSLLILMAVTSAGFLVWNWPPAKIFMGDVASGFLGMILGILALGSVIDSNVVTVWAWLCLFGIFLADSTFTLIRRMKTGQVWYRAHRSHAYQCASRKWGHKHVTLAVILINIFWCFPMAYLATQFPVYAALIAITAYIPLVVACFKLKAGLEN